MEELYNKEMDELLNNFCIGFYQDYLPLVKKYLPAAMVMNS